MKVGQTYIERETFIRIAKEAGCKIEDQASFSRITKPGNEENKVFVSKSQSVGRIDLSGFTVGAEQGFTVTAREKGEVKSHGDVDRFGGDNGGTNGRVLQWLEFRRNRDDVLGAFRRILEGLATWPTLPHKKRGRVAGFKGSKRTEPMAPVVQVVAAETPEQTVDRLVAELAKKRDMAKQMNSTLSKKTEEEYRAKIDAARTLIRKSIVDQVTHPQTEA